jgi:uncharacterized protein
LALTDLRAIQALIAGNLPSEQRFLYTRVNWGSRLVFLYGGRGVGKTTLMLQRLREEERVGRKALYFSADHVLLAASGIYEIAAEFFRYGGEIVFIDEAHKRPGWAQEIKSLYDSYPDRQLIVSGSSVLALQSGKTDLSRRAVYYRLPVLSFREYLKLVPGLPFEPLSIEALVADHERMAAAVLSKGPILGHFRDYLDRGVYPFVLEGEAEVLQRLENVIEKTLYEDLAMAEGRRAGGIPVMKKLLWLVATSPPLQFTIENVATDLRVSRPTVYSYLETLERAGLLMSIPPAGTGSRLTRKDSKLFLENTNFLWAISQSLTKTDPQGTLRETFFANQITSAGLILRVAPKGDFLVQDRFTFEVGGKHKMAVQVAGLENAYVARDGMEVGFGRIIPLWLFGMLY